MSFFHISSAICNSVERVGWRQNACDDRKCHNSSQSTTTSQKRLSNIEYIFFLRCAGYFDNVIRHHHHLADVAASQNVTLFSTIQIPPQFIFVVACRRSLWTWWNRQHVLTLLSSFSFGWNVSSLRVSVAQLRALRSLTIQAERIS